MRQRKIFGGARVRALRLEQGLTQGDFARKLGLSTSYVNQIENNQRALSGSVVVLLAQIFGVEVAEFATDTSERLAIDLAEVFADPVFGGSVPGRSDIVSLASTSPDIAQALLRLYESYRRGNERLASVDQAMTAGPAGNVSAYEEVRDYFHYAGNYIDPLDRAAETLAKSFSTHGTGKLEDLAGHFRDRHGIDLKNGDLERLDLLRKFDETAKTLTLSTRIPASSQFFQAAAQLALIEFRDEIEELTARAGFKSDAAREICSIGLANYFAGALHMPYAAFQEQAEAFDHDLAELAHTFGASLEQIAHRLSTLQRPGLKGVPFFFVKVDAAGTIVKRHSATPLQFARFGGACPLWNVHHVFDRQGGEIDRQLAETPDGNRYLSLAWAQKQHLGGFDGIERNYAYALGCELKHASKLVYSDGLDLENDNAFTPIGVNCRICERRTCPQRSVPPLAAEIAVNRDARAIIPYAF